MLFMDLTIVFALLALPRNVCASWLPPKIANLIYEWGPLVKLASGEMWNPAGVDYFLTHARMEGCSNQSDQSDPLTIYSIERCNPESYLTTKESITCPSCTEHVFVRGQDPSAAPVYVLYREHNNFLEVAYWFFFPYNRGKRVCIGYYADNICPFVKLWGDCTFPRINGCIGAYSTFGHHVGDWERVIVRFRKVNSDYQIYSMHLSVHSTDVTDKFGGEFFWKDGKFRKGRQSLAMHGGTNHAIIYSAESSHEMWPTAGLHVYKNLPNGDTPTDYTSNGEPWYTWDKLRITKYDPNGHYSGEFKFLEFSGRWGNKKRGCGIAEMISNECQLSDGVRGPHGAWPNFDKDGWMVDWSMVEWLSC